MTHDTDLCAELGHFIGQVTVVYCPHQQAWSVGYTAGDDSDDTALASLWQQLGPFDDRAAAMSLARGRLEALMRAHHSQWMARRRRPEDRTGDDVEFESF